MFPLSGPQSALHAAGRDAAEILEITLWMSGGALLAWVVVLAIGLRALGAPPANPRLAERLIVGLGGVGVPTVALTLLLISELPTFPRMLAPGPRAITVSGEQWWWRVRYHTPQGSFDLANEIRLPVGVRTTLFLESPDVIHSLWIPSLAGKMDLVPGRTTTLSLEPTETGVFRGACAEYCGASHAHMGLWAVVMEPAAYAAWLAEEAAPARVATEPLAQRGAEVFLTSGCGACHTVRGTPADGIVGPDLTHVGRRHSLAGALLPNDEPGFRRWLVHTGRLKPAVKMPTFDLLAEPDLDALAAWLESLR